MPKKFSTQFSWIKSERKNDIYVFHLFIIDVLIANGRAVGAQAACVADKLAESTTQLRLIVDSLPECESIAVVLQTPSNGWDNL